MLALFLGLIVSAGLYFAYMWPSIEPLEEPATAAGDSTAAPESPERDDDHDDGDEDKSAVKADEPDSTASAPS